ncbi:MAG: hypothetical protein HN416_15345 [Nitrospina sp.]|jgi:hypothetical protein|nr:hypothetical protein [Nitrospina sp.]
MEEAIHIYVDENNILAHHTTESCLSRYGQPVWVVEDENPDPGTVIWRQGENEVPLNVIGVKGGWLIVRQPDGLLSGIIWSDGTYHANLLEDSETGDPCTELMETGQRIRGTVQLNPDSPDDIGAILI